MADITKISWADRTFNPWLGCTEVGPGCDHCYARTLVQDRFHRATWGADQPRRRTGHATWNKVLFWNAEGQSWVFCASLADVFDNEVPEQWRLDLWHLIAKTKALRWMLLTKRVSNIDKMLPPDWNRSDYSHVGFMVTVVNQEEADRDVPRLLRLKQTQGFAWVGVSVEPMLGPMKLSGFMPVPLLDAPADYWKSRPRLDFVICGGESGPKARPMHPSWARQLRDQCATAGVPFHFKQNGEFTQTDPGEFYTENLQVFSDGTTMIRVGRAAAGHLLDGVEHHAMPRVYDNDPG